MRRTFSHTRASFASLLLLVTNSFAATPMTVNRQPVRPAWEIDLTDRLEYLPDCTILEKSALTNAGIPYSTATTRAARSGWLSTPDHVSTWRVPIATNLVPLGDTPVVVEFDEARVVTGLSFDGITLPRPDTSAANAWRGGEGATLLPVSSSSCTGTLVFQSAFLPQVYENGFGRLRLRPATLDESIDVGHPAGRMVALDNKCPFPLPLNATLIQEDYFGTPLSTTSSNLLLQACHVGALEWPLPPASRGHYRTILRLTGPGAVGKAEFRDYSHFGRETWNRDQVLRLNDGWSWQMSPGPLASQVPTTGWRGPVSVPHEPGSGEWTSHWMWYRTVFHLPADWEGQRVELYLPRVHYQARIMVDNTPIGEFPAWTLPDRILLPRLAAGAAHELAIAVTDYVVGLSPGIPVPPRGKSDIPSRGLAAPIRAAIGLPLAPELCAVPEVRVSKVALETRTSSRRSVKAHVELANSGSTTARVSLVASLHDKGRVLASKRVPSAALRPDSCLSREVELSSADIREWDPDNPALYEVRLELRDEEDGKLQDCRRERCGFREFTISGDHFTLNGKRINLTGMTHVVMDRWTAWPVRPLSCRLLRWAFPTATPFMGGRGGFQLADELGHLIKSELPDHNALHRDLYAYQLDCMWQRTESMMEAVAGELANHPSAVIWDVGNELWFAGPGEADRMVNLYSRLKSRDPSRLVTNSGGFPNVLPGADLIDWHGWPSIDTRATWLFFNPEKRPSYWLTNGVFAHVPRDGHKRGAPVWDIVSGPKPVPFGYPLIAQETPISGLHAYNRPILFSEGHYYENGFNEALSGLGGRVPLPLYPGTDPYQLDMAQTGMNYLQCRKYSMQNMRLSRAAGHIIHVDRGIGRWIQPLAALSIDRRFRARPGERLQTRFMILDDIGGTHVVHARWKLFSGTREVDTHTFHRSMNGGDDAEVALSLKIPDSRVDAEYRLHVDVGADGFVGSFRDDFIVTAFTPEDLRVPPGHALTVFDPGRRLLAWAADKALPLVAVDRIADWHPGPDNALIIGPEALSGVSGDQLLALRSKVRQGGTVAILDHRDLPAFLNRRMTQAHRVSGGVYFTDPHTPLARGLLSTDLQFWDDQDGDWIVTWNPLEIPVTGNFRVHARLENTAPALEVPEGAGRVLFCQLNLAGALGKDPAADRIMANLIHWTAQPSPFHHSPALVVSDDASFIGFLEARLGLECLATATPSAEQLLSSHLIVVDGTNAVTRNTLTRLTKPLNEALACGTTLFVQGLDAPGAAWLSELLGGAGICVRAWASDRAWLTSFSPLTDGLGHEAFWWHSRRNGVPAGQAQPLAQDSTGEMVLGGKDVTPLVTPAYLGTVPRGKGQVIISTSRPLDYPVTKPVQMLSMLLGNAGASLVPDGLSTTTATQSWAYATIDLRSFVNLPLSDNPGGRRGWHQSGPENDLRLFPSGTQVFHGVTYDLVDPDRCNGNGVIALSGSVGRGVLPSDIKGIGVHRKADRLYLLHSAAWGRPGFTYRVYYAADRKAWIPGQPAPYVDIEVNPQSNIADWWGVQSYANGDALLPGATVAWMGQTPRSRSQGDNWVGVFQMIWDNPHPEKEIESIDILSPGQVGSGQVFVFAITTASRQGAGTTSIPTSRVLPHGIHAEDVFGHWQNDRYGAVILTDGTIASIHDKSGNVLFRNAGWSLLNSRREGAPVTPHTPETLETQRGRRVEIRCETNSEGNITFATAPTVGKRFRWSQRVTCCPAALTVEQQFELTSPWSTDEGSPSIWNFSTGVAFNQDQFLAGPVTKPNERPVPVVFKSGMASIDFDDRYPGRWFSGYAVTKDGICFSPLDRQPLSAGTKTAVRYHITMP